MTILKGMECDILKDGQMDLSDTALAKLDIVGGSVHSHFNLSSKEQTARVIRAMENPHVDIIFHLTGRLINKRAGIELLIDAIIDMAKKTGTILEIDASPDRLDIRDEVIRKCVEKKVMMSIDSDAHAIEHFEFLHFGIGQARRGGAPKNLIINTYPVQKMLSFLKGKRKR